MHARHEPFRTPTTIAAGAIFAALVTVATYLFIIPIPATTGYFNLGESMVYIAALVFGPFSGLIAGAGASIADLLIPGGAAFAPATLIIKTTEGFMVGYLNKSLLKKTKSTTISATTSILVGGLIMIFGYFAYEVVILGFPMTIALLEVPFNIMQMLAGLAVAVPIIHAIRRVFPQLKNHL